MSLSVKMLPSVTGSGDEGAGGADYGDDDEEEEENY